MEADSRIKAYKFVAYSAVTFSVVAVLSVCVTLPMVYNYVQHVRQQMQHELKFCKVSVGSEQIFSLSTTTIFQGSAKDIWSEVSHLKSSPQDDASNRTARQYNGGNNPPVVVPGGNTPPPGLLPTAGIVNPPPGGGGSCDGRTCNALAIDMLLSIDCCRSVFKVVVCPDLLDLQDLPANLESPANLAHPVPQVFQALHRIHRAKVTHHHHASLAQLVHPVQMVHQVHQVNIIYSLSV